MPVETTENYIRIRQKDPNQFVKDSFRTIDISKDQGIKAVVGKLKSNPDGSTVVQTYLFDKEKWTTAKAEKWVADHKKKASSGEAFDRRFLDYPVRMDFENQKAPIIEGYAAVWDKPTTIFPGFQEQIKRGAFLETMKQDDIRALWNHDRNLVLGRNKSKTLTLVEDDVGLKYRIVAPETSWGKDAVISIKRGDVSQSSFGFRTIGKEDELDEETQTLRRTVTKAKLFDVSPVTFPAYPETEVHVRMIRNEGTLDYIFLDTDEVISMPLPEMHDIREEDLPTQDELLADFDALEKELREPRKKIFLQ